ncbi:MAG: vitamin B12-dependent ribonucleotide reductase [Armatimonadetes bacterium]|nr:vitamin B12-dependent ribonucleotide reductase [Armatimonadota bacterium]
MLTKNARTVLEKRYLRKDEDGKPIEDAVGLFRRVAEAIAEAEISYGKSNKHVKGLAGEFYELISSLDFLPNSPTLMNAGRELGQLSACFVLPIEDSMESIFETIKDTALIHKSGGGTGFSFSRLRPAHDCVKSTNGVSSGPISFMEVFNAATEAIKQGGTRRGANMGCLRVDHPDILDFITCKKDTSKLTNFNISVLLTEKFMEAVFKGEDYELISPRTGLVCKTLNAAKVFDLIVNMAWSNGEPGIIFIDRVNRDNPTPHLGEIESTNPCGEQPLLPYESCNLGSINLAHMVSVVDGRAQIDYDRLRRAVQLSVRFLDDVIDVNRYPMEQIAETTRGNRKIGLGVMGFADMLIQLGVPYDSEDGISVAEQVMSFVSNEGKKASCELAAERGVFANFKGSVYDRSDGMEIRNATVTTIAPTGTLSIIASCSSGIEPLFAISYMKRVMDGTELLEVNPQFEKIARDREFYSEELMRKIAEHGSVRGIAEVPEDVQRVFATALDIPPVWHIRMQAAFQRFTDNAVSKTVNFPESATADDVRQVYELAYKEGCKGCTIYRYGSRDAQVLNVSGKGKKPGSEKERGVRGPRPRPARTRGVTERINTGCGNMYVTINEDENGLCEVFAAMGKAGGCAPSQLEAIGRLISLSLRAGVDPESIQKHIRGIRCHSPAWGNGGVVMSCADAIGIAIEHYLKERETGVATDEISKPKDKLDTLLGACPDCGSAVEHESGCVVCRFCGFSKCG